MNKFAKWMKTNAKKQNGVAAGLGVHQTTVADIMKKQMPSLILAYKIEQYTKGDVTLYDWIDENMDKVNKVPEKKSKKQLEQTTE